MDNSAVEDAFLHTSLITESDESDFAVHDCWASEIGSTCNECYTQKREAFDKENNYQFEPKRKPVVGACSTTIASYKICARMCNKFATSCCLTRVPAIIDEDVNDDLVGRLCSFQNRSREEMRITDQNDLASVPSSLGDLIGLDRVDGLDETVMEVPIRTHLEVDSDVASEPQGAFYFNTLSTKMGSQHFGCREGTSRRRLAKEAAKADRFILGGAIETRGDSQSELRGNLGTEATESAVSTLMNQGLSRAEQ